MDKGMRRIRCNPDGSILFKSWNNTLIFKGKYDAMFETASGYEQTDGERKDYYDELLKEMLNEPANFDDLTGAGKEIIQLDENAYLYNGWETDLQY